MVLVYRTSTTIFRTAYRHFGVRNMTRPKRTSLLPKGQRAVHDKAQYESPVADLHAPSYNAREASETAGADRENTEDALEDRLQPSGHFEHDASSMFQPSSSQFYSKCGIMSRPTVGNKYSGLQPRKAGIFFILTDACLSHPDPSFCRPRTFKEDPLTDDTDAQPPRSYSNFVGRQSLGKRIIAQVNMENFSDQDLNAIIREENLLREHYGNLYEVEARANFYMYCAPCLRLLHTAMKIGCDAQANMLVNFHIRVDDRLKSTCCENTNRGQRLVDLIDSLKTAETSDAESSARLYDLLDRTWMEQRIYNIEEDAQPHNEHDTLTARQLDHIFNPDGYDEKTTAGIIVLGEVAEITKIMESQPFVRSSRMPRPTEIFKMEPSYDQTAKETWYQRRPLGTYTRNFKPLSSEQLLERQTPASPAYLSVAQLFSEETHKKSHKQSESIFGFRTE